MSFRLSPREEDQLDDIWLCIARQSCSFPTFGQTVPYWTTATGFVPGTPEFLAGDYAIIYSIEDDDMVVIHPVIHGSQDTGLHFPH
ncbi:MAG: type II toxin-antitoxin system RelE/ParE family toxin [Terriglobia bacterium]